jgi:hypothetical protein
MENYDMQDIAVIKIQFAVNRRMNIKISIIFNKKWPLQNIHTN